MYCSPLHFSSPYVGITGFTRPEEISCVLEAMPASSKRLFMVGVLMSEKMFLGEEHKFSNRYPLPAQVSQLFFDHPHVLNLVHYHTENPDTLLEQMELVSQVAGPYLHGFQLKRRSIF